MTISPNFDKTSNLYRSPLAENTGTVSVARSFPPPESCIAMIYLVKTALALFTLGWLFFGGWLVVKYAVLFGPHQDDPAESVGARSFGVTHICLVWFGFFSLGVYFLFR